MDKALPKDIDGNFLARQTRLILDSYLRWTGKALISFPSSHPQAPSELFAASFPVLSSTPDPDPFLNYGNQATLELWEMTWQELIQTPGRKTAEPMERKQRENFLQTVREKGFISSYSGIRISRTGKRFEIRNATVWNLLDDQGIFRGQAASFRDWKYL